MSKIDWAAKPDGYPLWIVPMQGFEAWPAGWHKDSGDLYIDQMDRPWAKSDEGKRFKVFTDPNGWPNTGRPPVDTKCQALIKGKDELWVECHVIWHHPEFISSAAVVHGEGRLLCWSSNFRPMPTPEQERHAGLNEMIRHIKDHPLGTHGASHLQELMIHEDVARDLWDAGYRKQEAS